MIAVKWEFQGDDQEAAAAEAVIQRILARYRQGLEGIRCPVHGAGTRLSVRGHTLEDLDLIVEPCCELSPLKPAPSSSKRGSSGGWANAALQSLAHEAGMARRHTPLRAWLNRLLRNRREHTEYLE